MISNLMKIMKAGKMGKCLSNYNNSKIKHILVRYGLYTNEKLLELDINYFVDSKRKIN